MRPVESFVGQPIRSLQTMLRVIATDQGNSVSIIPDGIYGRDTVSGIMEFQRSRGLAVTGIADQDTWEHIVRDYEHSLIRQNPAKTIEVILEPGQVIRRGETHPDLLLAQGMLLILSRVYGSVNEPSLTGTLDLATAQSIESFQTLSLLPMTGELDKTTWKHLALQYPLAANLVVQDI